MDEFGLDSLLSQNWIDFVHEIQIPVHGYGIHVGSVIGKLG